MGCVSYRPQSRYRPNLLRSCGSRRFIVSARIRSRSDSRSLRVPSPPAGSSSFTTRAVAIDFGSPFNWQAYNLQVPSRLPHRNTQVPDDPGGLERRWFASVHRMAMTCQPASPRAQHLNDAADHAPIVDAVRSATTLRKVRLYRRPLRIRQPITCFRFDIRGPSQNLGIRLRAPAQAD